ncbi:polysaccharide pyruvyl transferase family protein [Paraburkholderia sp. D1E]|uniref:polysaccharide pyruvyl transferase family protein n=1 Tax=Paraburkholderia sp. D1E TaxID=3461398 RepID=UPI004045F6F1
MWTDDPSWVKAAGWVKTLQDSYSYVLAPDSLQGVATRCLPLEYSHIADMRSCAIVMPKDSVGRLALSWIEQLKTFEVIWVDEVFVVLGGSKRSGLPTATEAELVHIGFLWDRVAAVLGGRPIRPNNIDKDLSSAEDDRPYILMINACQTENPGENLMAAAVIRTLSDLCPNLRWVIADPAVDRTLVAGAEIVVLGPGGYLYDLEDHAELRIDFQNTANYFRFGFEAREYKKPFFVVGIGHQQDIVSVTTTRFISKALEDARFLTTRDMETASLVFSKIGFGAPLVATEDLSVAFAEEVRLRAGLASDSTRVLAVAGGFSVEELFETIPAADGTIRFILQSIEDVQWFAQNEAPIRSNFKSVEVVDVHGFGYDILIDAVVSADALITSRFHSMMIGLMAGIETLACGKSGDKRERVCRRFRQESWVNFVDLSNGRSEQFCQLGTRVAREGRRVPSRGLFSPSDLASLRNLFSVTFPK